MPKYEVIANLNVRHRIIVEANSPEGAENIMDALVDKIDWNSTEMDTLISGYLTEAKDISDANL